MIKTHKLQKLLFAIALFSIAFLHLEGQSLQWASDFKNASGKGICSDAAGNTYVTGTFVDTTDFDPGPGFAIASSASHADIFVLKYDPSGNLLWFRTVGGDFNDIPKALDIDQMGNIIIAGTMDDGLDFSNVGVSVPADDIFLWKLNPAGNTLWVKGFSASDNIHVADIGIGGNGEVYMAGDYKGIMDMDPGAGIATFQAVSRATFLVKLDNNGGYLDALTFQSTASTSTATKAFEIDAYGTYLACGAFGDSVDIDPGPGTIFLSNPNPLTGKLVVIKLSHAGNLIWAKNIVQGGYYADIRRLETDGFGNVYFGGLFENYLDCDPDPNSAAIVSQQGEVRDAFLIKWDSSGQYLNSGTLSNDSRWGAKFHSMDVDAQGNTYISTGMEYQGYVDIELGSGVHLEGSSTEVGSIVVKYGPDFSILWVGKHFGPYTPVTYAYGYLESTATHLSADGSLMLTGYGFLGADLDPEDSVLNFSSITSFSQGSAFAYRMNCGSSNTYAYYSACDSVSIFGQTFAESGLHHFRFPDGQGCDSVVTVHVDVLNPVVAEIYLQGRLMTEPIDDAQYQWLDCGNNYAPVANQNNYYMDVGPVGNYAVAVTIQGCTDTSACYTATLSPVQETREDLSSFRIATNPEGLRLLHPGPFSATLIDLQGRVLATSEARDEAVFAMGGFPAGVYMVRVQTRTGVASRKVMWMGQ